jgi:F-type H+-transporting ATPase subunit delta
MTSINDREIAVARVYSDALMEVAEERGETEAIAGELAELARLVQRDEAFGAFLSSPTVDATVRGGALERMLRGRAGDLLVNFLLVLNRRQRLSLLPAVAEVFHQSYNERLGRIEVKVKSATPLTATQRDQLAGAIARRTGRQAVLTEVVDPALIGGLVVRLGGRQIDGSVATQLQNLSQTLLARAAREIGSGVYVEP